MSLPLSSVFVTLAEVADTGLVEFYTHVLGQQPTLHIPHVYAEFQLSGLRLGIFQPKAGHDAEFRAPTSGGMSLCLEVKNLEIAIAFLTELGCPPLGDIAIATHGREIYAYDPAGNRLILHEAWQTAQ